MNSISFGKKCREYNLKYKELFGYVPCRDDYQCNQDEFFAALISAIENKVELSTIIPKRVKDYSDKTKIS